jgi:hypothetical protein
MADPMTILRRVLGLEHAKPEAMTDDEHQDEHELINRRLNRQDRRIKALDARVDVQRAGRR